MIHRVLFIFFISVFTCASAFDPEIFSQDFVLETKRIYLPGYPDAFNPSIVRWKGKLLMSFRNIANPKDSYNSSEIGLVWLNEQFDPVSLPQILPLGNLTPFWPKRAEDARLIIIDGHLFLIYSDNEDLLIKKDRFRIYVAELIDEEGLFYLQSKDRLEEFEGNDRGLREKNWTPFEYDGTLLLSYSLNPHIVFKPMLGSSNCETYSISTSHLNWSWGELRGGTQLLQIDNNYLTFFHSSLRMISDYSDGKEMLHYFMGACIFDCEPPFAMTGISPEPIVGPGFFSGNVYKPYWGSWRGNFPGGFVFDDHFIYIVYGKQNHELWMVKLDKKGLFDSLVLPGP